MSVITFRADLRTGLQFLAEGVAKTAEGNRNHTLYWAAIRAAEEGYEPDDIMSELFDGAMRAGLNRVEARRTIHSGLAKATQDDLWGTMSPSDHRHEFEAWLACAECQERKRASDAAVAEEDEPTAEGFVAPGFESIAALLDGWDSALDAFTVEHLLRPGYRCLISAYESTGKTYFGLQLALHLTSPQHAGPAFGQFAVNEPLTVLYVDGEVGRGEMLRRLRSLSSELGVPLDDELPMGLLTLDTRLISLKDKTDMQYLAASVDKAYADTGRKVALFLDSTDSLYGKELWGAGAEGYDAAIKWLMDGRRDWLIVITLVHTVKKPRDQKASYKVDLQDVLGNVTRQADAVVILDVKGERALTMGIYKRPGRSQGVLQRDEDGHAWRWTHDMDDEPAVGANWKIALPFVLRAMGVERWTAGTLSAKLVGPDGKGPDRNTVRGYLETLVAKHMADSEVEDPDKRNSPTHYWLTPAEAAEA